MPKSTKIITPQHESPYYRQHLRDERAHMEGLLNQRFNFFIIILGAIIASFPVIQNPTQLKIVLIAGLIFEFLFMLLIGRAQKRLNINLELLKSLPNDPTEEITLITKKTSRLNPYRYSVSRLIGFYIPILINLTLFFSIFYAEYLFMIIKEGK